MLFRYLPFSYCNKTKGGVVEVGREESKKAKLG